MPTLNLIEYPDIELCKSIWRHPEIWEEDRARAKKYCGVAVEHGLVPVSYDTKFGFGRLYPTNPYSATILPLPRHFEVGRRHRLRRRL